MADLIPKKETGGLGKYAYYFIGAAIVFAIFVYWLNVPKLIGDFIKENQMAIFIILGLVAITTIFIRNKFVPYKDPKELFIDFQNTSLGKSLGIAPQQVDWKNLILAQDNGKYAYSLILNGKIRRYKSIGLRLGFSGVEITDVWDGYADHSLLKQHVKTGKTFAQLAVEYEREKELQKNLLGEGSL